jgi:GH24 family phage-related lysozyme (muramidase)
VENRAQQLAYILINEDGIHARALFDDLPPPAEHHAASSFSPDFIEFIKRLETEPASVYKAKSSAEGGTKTIGYGHKLQPGANLDQISAKDAERRLIQDLEHARSKVYSYIKKKHAINIMLDRKQEEMLTEFVFNLGGLEKFPKFTDAVLRKDWPRASGEFRRFYQTPDGQKRELKLRNRLFAERYGLK